MGFLLKFIVFSLVLASASSHFNSSEEGFISTVISQKGLNFIKDLLIEKAVSTIIPLRLPDIEKTVNIILVGKVHVVLSDIVIGSLEVDSSDIQIGERGINIVVMKATANLSMNWRYTYGTWLFEISDEGDASVQVILLLSSVICFYLNDFNRIVNVLMLKNMNEDTRGCLVLSVLD